MKIGLSLVAHGNADAFVAKVKADGSGLAYAGFLGGANYDVAMEVAVDPAGNAYVTGQTQSDEKTFPVTIGPDLHSNGGGDAFVANVKADGSGFFWAGCIGGDLEDVGEAIAKLKEQADLVVQSADETQAMLARLESMKGVQPHLDAVDRLESEGDAVHRRILARLFSGEFEALDVIRWKDVIESMEAALNTLEDISDVVESIVLKHA